MYPSEIAWIIRSDLLGATIVAQRLMRFFATINAALRHSTLRLGTLAACNEKKSFTTFSAISGSIVNFVMVRVFLFFS